MSKRRVHDRSGTARTAAITGEDARAFLDGQTKHREVQPTLGPRSHDQSLALRTHVTVGTHRPHLTFGERNDGR